MDENPYKSAGELTNSPPSRPPYVWIRPLLVAVMAILGGLWAIYLAVTRHEWGYVYVGSLFVPILLGAWYWAARIANGR